MSDPRAFVAGATGHTGRSVVEACTRRGVPTVAHVRPDSPRRAEWERLFADMGATVDATPWERPAMAATLVRIRPTHVFILVGTTRARSRRAAREGRDETYASVDLALPLLLADAAEDAAAADPTLRPRLVYLSAIGAREDARSAYVRARGRVERRLREGRLPWLAVRPAVIAGERDERRPLERLTAVVGDLLLQPLRLVGAGRLRDRLRSTTGAELGEGMVRVALAERGEGRVVGADEVR